MKRVRFETWCVVSIVALAMFTEGAFAQFGGGNQTADAFEKHEAARLEMFKVATPTEPAQAPPETPCRCLGEAEGNTVARINQVLAQPLKSSGLEFTEQPLEDIVNFLQEEYEIPIKLDVNALEDAGMTPDEPADANVQGTSLKSALRHMLHSKQLTYMIRNEMLIITTPERVEQELETCVYDVRDLATSPRAFKALADTITACIASGSWAENGGGEAEIQPVQPGLLVIAQTRPVHEEIGELLAAIRKYRHDDGGHFEGGEVGPGGEFGGSLEPTATIKDEAQQ